MSEPEYAELDPHAVVRTLQLAASHAGEDEDRRSVRDCADFFDLQFVGELEFDFLGTTTHSFRELVDKVFDFLDAAAASGEEE
jgi:hypothetical protein